MSDNIYELDKVHVSKYTGDQIDFLIESILNMQPQIHVTGAGNTVRVTCSNNDNSYSATTDATGKCTIYVTRYGTYNVTKANSDPISVVVDEYKTYNVSFS